MMIVKKMKYLQHSQLLYTCDISPDTEEIHTQSKINLLRFTQKEQNLFFKFNPVQRRHN